jgi:hypothetical protein
MASQGWEQGLGIDKEGISGSVADGLEADAATTEIPHQARQKERLPGCTLC